MVIAVSVRAAPAPSAEKVLYAFQGGSDGSVPQNPLTADRAGNLYGMTYSGGGGNCRNGSCGTVFKLAPDGSETVLHAFADSDGAYPGSNLILDQSGNLYGTTSGGGLGAGIVFKLTPNGTESILYSFQAGSDGASPVGNIAVDKDGNIYGTTEEGGGGSNCGTYGCGTVFKLSPDGTEIILYAFQGGGDGNGPLGGVILDGGGNLLGTTYAGGSNCTDGSSGCGTVFKVAPDGAESVLYAFQGGNDGAFPFSGLLMDTSGNLYGTTLDGGGTGCSGLGCGVVFKIAPGGSESVLYAFKGGSDGQYSQAGVIRDKAGNLYGTTYYGGGTRCHGAGCGTVFKVAPDGTEKVLARFGVRRGTGPAAALLEGKHGLLYGTATAGGARKDGVVFSVKK